MADLAVNTDSLDMDDLEAEFAVLTSPEPDDEVDLDAMMAEMEADDAAFTLQLHPASRGVTAKSDVADVDEAAPSSELLVTAGRDGNVKVWNEQWHSTQTFDIGATAVPRPVDSALRSVAMDPRGLKIMVGTQSGELYDVVRASGSVTLLCLPVRP